MGDWWDTIDSGNSGFSLTGGDTYDLGSFNPQDYAFSGGGYSFGSQPLDFGLGGGIGNGGGLGFNSQLQDPTQGFSGGYSAPSPMAAPGAATPQAGGGATGGWMSPQGVGLGLGVLGGLAGIAGQLAGGGKGPSQTTQQTRTLTPQAQNNVTQSYQALTPIAQGISPLQQQQNSLLAALANGQGLPPGYAQLIEQAFQPQFGDVYQQAVNAGRARGFYDAPGTSPAGSNVLGPALSNLQGQMAQAKLGLMQSLPGIYNTPIANQTNAAQGLSASLLNGAQFGQGLNQTQNTQAGSLAPQIGQMVGVGLQGVGQAITQQQRDQQQQDNFNRMMSGINMSGAPRQ